MNNHIAAEDLSAYLDGALPPIAMQAAARHLSECASCRGQWQALRRVSSALQQSPPATVPPFFAARLAQRIQAQRELGLWADFVWLGKRLVPALAVLLALALMWGPFTVQVTGPQETDYLAAAGASSAMSLLAENSNEMTAEEMLELVVANSALASE